MWAIAIPVLCFTLSTGFSTGALLAKQNSRPALCLPICFFTLLSFLHLKDVTSDVGQASVIGLFLLIWLSHILNVLLLEEYVVPGTSRTQKWRAAYKMLFNARWLGTSNQAHNIRMRKTVPKSNINLDPLSHPPVVDVRTTTPKAVWNERSLQRHIFIATRAISAVTIYSANHIYEQYILLTPYPTLYKPLQISDFSPTKQTYIRRLLSTETSPTTRETALRAMLAFHFVWSAWATFTFLHDVLAFLFVGILRLDEPDDWPPLYGALAEAYTVQKFWSRFWHSLVYRTYTSYGTRLSRHVLLLKPRSALDRLAVQFFVFASSGVVHALVSRQVGLCGYWEDVQWFCLNFVALAIERSVLSARNRLLGQKATQHIGWRYVGYLWVFAFMFWSLPKSQYPKIYCAVTEV